MKDFDLDRILKRLPVPQKPDSFWEEFPSRVLSRIDQRERIPDVSSKHLGLRLPWPVSAFGIGLALFCIVLSLVFVHRPAARVGSAGISDPVASTRKYFHELDSLFPHQIQAIVFDHQGPHLILADKPDVPASPPLYLRICGPNGCESYVTFSGQQIRIDGSSCDVLVDHSGDVLVIGPQLRWSSVHSLAGHNPYRIEARLLESTS